MAEQDVEERRSQQRQSELTMQPDENRSLDEKLAEIAARIPKHDLAKLPTDLGDQLDHFIYGTPRR